MEKAATKGVGDQERRRTPYRWDDILGLSESVRNMDHHLTAVATRQIDMERALRTVESEFSEFRRELADHAVVSTKQSIIENSLREVKDDLSEFRHELAEHMLREDRDRIRVLLSLLAILLTTGLGIFFGSEA